MIYARVTIVEVNIVNESVFRLFDAQNFCIVCKNLLAYTYYGITLTVLT